MLSTFSTGDTIVAIATPPGRGGLGVVRVSGVEAHRIACVLAGRASPLQPRHATFARVRGAGLAPAIDQVIMTFFPAPASYTGEDTVEISAHGSPVVLREIVEAGMAAGARLAEPGEFTLRAFLNGRIDLVQAEAVADLIDAVTPLQARAAFDQLEGTLTSAIGELDARLFDLIAKLEASLDFPDEGYHFAEPGDLARDLARLAGDTRALVRRARTGRLVREGLQVVIAGKPNVGKSTLFNTLAGAGRAIVAAQPGTTRDLVTETVEIEGLKVTLVDTAGIRETSDEVEAEGVARARQAQDVADLQVLVLDASRLPDEEDRHCLSNDRKSNKLLVINKIDCEIVWPEADRALIDWQSVCRISLRTGEGMEQFRRELAGALGADSLERDPVIVTNARHSALLAEAVEALERARSAVDAAAGAMPEEFVLHDLHAAREAFEQVRGRRASDDLLREIFSRFCIGK